MVAADWTRISELHLRIAEAKQQPGGNKEGQKSGKPKSGATKMGKLEARVVCLVNGDLTKMDNNHVVTEQLHEHGGLGHAVRQVVSEHNMHALSNQHCGIGELKHEQVALVSGDEVKYTAYWRPDYDLKAMDVIDGVKPPGGFWVIPLLFEDEVKPMLQKRIRDSPAASIVEGPPKKGGRTTWLHVYQRQDPNVESDPKGLKVSNEQKQKYQQQAATENGIPKSSTAPQKANEQKKATPEPSVGTGASTEGLPLNPPTAIAQGTLLCPPQKPTSDNGGGRVSRRGTAYNPIPAKFRPM